MEMDGRETFSRQSKFVASSVTALPFMVGPRHRIFLLNGHTRSYNLNIAQRLFLTFNDSNSSILANAIGFVVVAAIVLNIIIVIAATTPNLRVTPTTCPNPACSNTDLCPGFEICAPVDAPIFTLVNTICVALFTIDYGIRVLICPLMPTRLCDIVSDDWDEREQKLAAAEDRTPREEPEYSWYWQFFTYWTLPMNLVDLVAILPFYIVLGLQTASAQKISFIRMLRLFRLFKLFRYFKGPATILQQALYKSREVFSILALSFMIAIIFFSFIMFDLEQGEFQVSNYTVSQGFENGAYVRASKDNQGIGISPFDSVPTSMYWAVITLTTVGYGDLTPITRDGRTVACFAAIIGIFTLALPLGVVGSNFMAEFEAYNARIRAEEERAEAELKELNLPTFSIPGIANPAMASVLAKMSGKFGASRSNSNSAYAAGDKACELASNSKVDAGGFPVALPGGVSSSVVSNPMASISAGAPTARAPPARAPDVESKPAATTNGEDKEKEDEAAARSRATAEATALLALPPAQRQGEVERLLLTLQDTTTRAQQLEGTIRRMCGEGSACLALGGRL